MSEPKPDIMDGCGVSSWIVMSLVLLLLIPIGIRTCADSGNEVSVDEKEQIQRLSKIKDSQAEERAIRQQLGISLENAMERTLEKYNAATPSDKNASQGGDQE